MEKKINNVLIFTSPSGEKTVFRVLFTYRSDVFNKDYAVFYNEADENELIAYSFDENKTLSLLSEEGEYAELNRALQKYDEEVGSN